MMHVAQPGAGAAAEVARQQADLARELAALQAATSGQPPIPPPAPPGTPVEGAPPAGQAGAGQPVVVIDGKRYLLSRESGGEALTVAEAKREFGDDTNEILHNVIPIVGIIFGSVTLWMVLDIAAKFLTKRAERVHQRQLAQLAQQGDAERFARLEQAVEAVAVEVERITEAQRFQTKLLTERAASLPDPTPALAPTRAEPAAIPRSR